MAMWVKRRAAATKPNETSSSPRILARLLRPRLRSRDTFSQSSRPPTMAAPIMVATTMTPRRVNVPDEMTSLMSQPMVAATTMAMPPMVGRAGLAAVAGGTVLADGLADPPPGQPPDEEVGADQRQGQRHAGGDQQADHASTSAGHRAAVATGPAPRPPRPGRRSRRSPSPRIWVVSWPLPAITTASPGPAAASAAADGGPPVGLDDQLAGRDGRCSGRSPVSRPR